METKILMPSPGESVTEAQISRWHKKDGDFVKQNEVLLELETDKATLEVIAETAGFLKIDVLPNQVMPVGTVLGRILSEGQASAELAAVVTSSAAEKASTQASDSKESRDLKNFESPAVQRVLGSENIKVSEIQGSGKDGRVTKADALDFVAKKSQPETSVSASAPTVSTDLVVSEGRTSRTVPLSMMRRRIAQRLKEVQNTAAILTTFNEVDMSQVMALRDKYKESFKKKHEVGLGFMSFFTRACVEALKQWPSVNAEWQKEHLEYRDYYDIGVAVSSEKGLVVPVIRNAENLSLSGIEKEILRLAHRARDGKLSIEEMSGGTFTITNGGVFGSMLSTPILNSPQTAILGMHNIVKRPVVVDDVIVVRPVMYLALSYDHRVIDGKEAVQFLVTVKNYIEDPTRLLLEV